LWVWTCVLFKVDSYEYQADVCCFDVEKDEAAEINDRFIFNPFLNPQASPNPPSASLTPVSEGGGQVDLTGSG
jgi:hypothetical protein